MTPSRFRLAAALGAALMVGDALLAQAGPPLAKAPRDSAPPLLKPVAPSPPPSSRAPRAAPARSNAVAPTEAPVAVAPRYGMPVDSARPQTSANPEAPNTGLTVRRPPPPLPAATAPAAVQTVESSAAARSAEPPAGATGRCKDGTWLFGAIPAAPCGANGGLAVRLPDPKPVPRPPRP